MKQLTSAFQTLILNNLDYHHLILLSNSLQFLETGKVASVKPMDSGGQLSYTIERVSQLCI